MLNTLLVIFFILGLIWILWRRFKPKRLETSQEAFKSGQELVRLSIMEDAGTRIVGSMTPAAPSKLSLPTYNIPSLDPLLASLQKQVVSIVVGKYKLDDPATINHLNARMAAVLEHLSTSSSPESIVSSYNPTQNNDLILEACRDLMEYPHLDPLKKILVAQYIVNKTQLGEELDVMYNYIASMALDPRQSPIVRAEAADVLNLSNSTRYMKLAGQALELLRQLDDAPVRPLRKPSASPVHTPAPVMEVRRVQIPEAERTDVYIIPPMMGRPAANVPALPRVASKPDRSVYEDSQSVHNTGINESVLEAAKELIEKNRPAGFLSIDHDVLEKLPPDSKKKAEASLHRINTDSSTFKHGSTLFSIYQALLKFISSHPQKDDLNQRLAQELVEMNSTCSSGHMSRLMNTLQGFEVGKELKIKVKIDDEVYGKTKHSIEKALQEAENSDELIEDMSSPTKARLVAFTLELAHKIIPDILKEYQGIASEKEVRTSIIKSLDKYTSTVGKFTSLS